MTVWTYRLYAAYHSASENPDALAAGCRGFPRDGVELYRRKRARRNGSMEVASLPVEIFFLLIERPPRVIRFLQAVISKKVDRLIQVL